MTGHEATIAAPASPTQERSGRRPLRGRGLARVLTFWFVAWWVPVALLLPAGVPGRPFVLAALAAAALTPIPFLLGAFLGRRYPSARRRLLLFRPFWYLHLFMPLAAIAGVFGALIGLLFGNASTLGAAAMSAALLVLAVLILVGYVGTRQLAVRHLELAFPDLPDGLDGLRVVQLSDLHVGPHTRQAFLGRIAATVADLRPDLLVITGDQVDDFAEDVAGFVKAFGHLRAPLGVYAVAGNHDIYAGWPAVKAGLEAGGFTVLENEAVPLAWRGSRLWLAGTGDPAGNAGAFSSAAGPAPNIGRTLANIPAGAFVVALAHNPALWPALAARGVQLTLSGHTHYGQLAVPRLGWSVASLFLRHAFGLYRDGAKTLYINPGTNYWGIPFRVGTPPEVTVVSLTRAAAAG